MKEIIYFKGSDGEIPANVFYPEGKVRAVVQFVHGMTEHSGRYEEFAEYLNSHDVAFVSYDLRGHGKNKIRKFFHVDGKLWCNEVFIDIHIVTSIKESIERVS